MNPTDFAQFKAALEELRQELEAQLQRRDSSDDSIVPDNAIGRLTRMEAIQSQQVSEAGRRRAKSRLGRVKRALEAIEAGDYGSCTRCGEPVPWGRLEIMPESSLCVQCAGRS